MPKIENKERKLPSELKIKTTAPNAYASINSKGFKLQTEAPSLKNEHKSYDLMKEKTYDNF